MPGKRKIVEVALLDPERFIIRHEDGPYMVVSTYDLLDVPVVEPLGSATLTQTSLLTTSCSLRASAPARELFSEVCSVSTSPPEIATSWKLSGPL